MFRALRRGSLSGNPFSGNDSSASHSMLDYWRFFRHERALLSFGLGFTFLSSFGQTFLISLFVPSLLETFELGSAGFGTLYAAATMASAFLLPWAGRWLDRAPLTRFSVAVILLMVLSCLLMAAANHIAVLALALVGLRLSGQGLCGQTAVTAMARYYSAARGKALSIASLGFPAGEAFLPLLVLGTIALIGWRATWIGVAAVVLLVFWPALLYLLARSGKELDPRRLESEAPPPDRASSDPDPVGRSWKRREVLRDLRLWLILPAALLPPFWATGLFLYQTNIAGVKGWGVSLMAAAFAAFALTRVVCSLAVGGVVDRYSARSVFPFSLIPLGIALLVLLLYDGRWVPFTFMGFLGVAMGLSGNVKAALWAELYGIRHLGAIKSMMAALMVVSTAAAPIAMGPFVDTLGSLVGVLLAGVGSVVAATLLTLWALFGTWPEPAPGPPAG